MKCFSRSLVVIVFIGMMWTCAQAQEIHDPPDCPTIAVSAPDDIPSAPGELMKFTATVSGVDPKITPTFEWTVSGGSITNGQGTTVILVEPNDAGGGTITATLKVGGMSDKCVDKASATMSFFVCGLVMPALKFDEYGEINFKQETARLDNFATELLNVPTATAYIIVYAGSDASRDKAKARALRVENYLIRTRGIDPERVASIYGGNRKQKTVELFIVPVGAENPAPSATMDLSQRNP